MMMVLFQLHTISATQFQTQLLTLRLQFQMESGKLKSSTIGVVSDGDIRRAIMKTHDAETLQVKDVMNGNPKFIEEKDLAAKALQIMEKYSITSLLVNDENGCPKGIIHIHDLLKAGVA